MTLTWSTNKQCQATILRQSTNNNGQPANAYKQHCHGLRPSTNTALVYGPAPTLLWFIQSVPSGTLWWSDMNMLISLPRELIVFNQACVKARIQEHYRTSWQKAVQGWVRDIRRFPSKFNITQWMSLSFLHYMKWVKSFSNPRPVCTCRSLGQPITVYSVLWGRAEGVQHEAWSCAVSSVSLQRVWISSCSVVIVFLTNRNKVLLSCIYCIMSQKSIQFSPKKRMFWCF